MSALELAQPAVRSIVLVIGSMGCGGAERVMADMANYWVERGWQVTVATWSSRNTRDFYVLSSHISRVWLQNASRGDAKVGTFRSLVSQVFALRRLLRRVKPDVVLSFIDVSNVLTLLAALGLGVPVVISERTHPLLNDTISRPWKLMRRLCYSRAHQVIAQTRDAAGWIERRCRTTVQVIPNFLRTLPEAVAPRESLIIAVGRLSREKGFDILIEAFARVRAQFPDWQLRIIGAGPEQRSLADQITRLSLQTRVELVGQVADVEAWMARAALLVHPSRREGFPNAVLEAMGMGVAVVCADCRSGPSELIEDGVNGRLVPVDDLESLTLAMSQLMADSKLRERLGKEATKVRQQFAQSVLMKRWEACLLPLRAGELK
jgi:GalNAc-alpha-(1->4)-GalNAc-alpha-(1->3)-diNAcBac-PP-undecaprenol alpha-1,4-N-acetyl-D-galactosaminyltransferase